MSGKHGARDRRRMRQAARLRRAAELQRLVRTADEPRTEEELQARAAEKADRNRMSTLRGKRRSLVNWKMLRLLKAPITFTDRNRSEAKEDELFGLDPAEIRNNQKRRNRIRLQEREDRQIAETGRKLSMVAVSGNRSKRRQSSRRGTKLTSASGARYAARKAEEQRVYQAAIKQWAAQPEENRLPLRVIQQAVAHARGVDWRRYEGV